MVRQRGFFTNFELTIMVVVIICILGFVATLPALHKRSAEDPHRQGSGRRPDARVEHKSRERSENTTPRPARTTSRPQAAIPTVSQGGATKKPLDSRPKPTDLSATDDGTTVSQGGVAGRTLESPPTPTDLSATGDGTTVSHGGATTKRGESP